LRRFGRRENHNLFASESANVVVQAERFDAGDTLNQRFQRRPRDFDQLRSDLLQQVATFLR